MVELFPVISVMLITFADPTPYQPTIVSFSIWCKALAFTSDYENDWIHYTGI